MKERLTQEEFEKQLQDKHGEKKIYKHCWLNYPRSTFYYDTPDMDGTTDNIGIYTNATTYSLGPA